MKSFFPHLTALAILFHVVVITILAIPVPAGQLNKRNFNDPDVQDALKGWSSLAQTVGMDVDDKAFSKSIWTLARKMVKTRNKMVAPVKPYYRYTGTWQHWLMFGHVNRQAGLLEIHLRDDGVEEWQPLFVELSEHDWMSSVINQERVRALRANFANRKSKKFYRAFCKWLAKRAAQDFPQAHQIRFQYQGVYTPRPKMMMKQGGLTRKKIFWSLTLDLDEWS